MRNLQETFGYDLQNRLTEVRLGSVQTGTSAYDGYGRMTAETLSGVFPSHYDIHFISQASYNDTNPHNSYTVTLIVPPSHWNTFKNKYNSVFRHKRP